MPSATPADTSLPTPRYWSDNLIKSRISCNRVFAASASSSLNSPPFSAAIRLDALAARFSISFASRFCSCPIRPISPSPLAFTSPISFIMSMYDCHSFMASIFSFVAGSLSQSGRPVSGRSVRLCSESSTPSGLPSFGTICTTNCVLPSAPVVLPTSKSLPYSCSTSPTPMLTGRPSAPIKANKPSLAAASIASFFAGSMLKSDTNAGTPVILLSLANFALYTAPRGVSRTLPPTVTVPGSPVNVAAISMGSVGSPVSVTGAVIAPGSLENAVHCASTVVMSSSAAIFLISSGIAPLNISSSGTNSPLWALKNSPIVE